MGAENLGIVFAPSLFWAEEASIESLQATGSFIELVSMLINNYESLFDKSLGELPAYPWPEKKKRKSFFKKKEKEHFVDQFDEFDAEEDSIYYEIDYEEFNKEQETLNQLQQSVTGGPFNAAAIPFVYLPPLAVDPHPSERISPSPYPVVPKRTSMVVASTSASSTSSLQDPSHSRASLGPLPRAPFLQKSMTASDMGALPVSGISQPLVGQRPLPPPKQRSDSST